MGHEGAESPDMSARILVENTKGDRQGLLLFRYVLLIYMKALTFPTPVQTRETNNLHTPAHLQVSGGEIYTRLELRVKRALAGNDRHEALREPPGGAVPDEAKRVPGSEVFDGILGRESLRE